MTTSPTPGAAFTCLLCGARFGQGERACPACPLARGCDVVRCPRCGYSFPRSSRVVEGLRALVRRWGRKEERS